MCFAIVATGIIAVQKHNNLINKIKLKMKKYCRHKYKMANHDFSQFYEKKKKITELETKIIYILNDKRSYKISFNC